MKRTTDTLINGN